MYNKLGEHNKCCKWQCVCFISGKTPGVFDHIIINNDVEKAYSELRNVVIKVCLPCGDFLMIVLIKEVEAIRKNKDISKI